MASVTSLDKDLRKLRLAKYTPQAAREAQSWIETILGERLPSSDLLESLKDGVALCRLVNLAIGPPGIKFKKSNMPFVQMENISLFLNACKSPPLNMQEHDVFLTVDLYEGKDPAQVLQCLAAFSRAANAVNPAAFPSAIGPKPKAIGVMSPQSTGGGASQMSPTRTRNLSSASVVQAHPQFSPSKNGRSSPSVSSWSRKEQETATSPAWNIAQYGYMGGASQGNLGIAFGGRRQITTASPQVPSFVDKEKMRREKEAEEERQRLAREEAERQRRAEAEAEEQRAREEEQRRWEEETKRLREEEERKWAEQERQWKLAEEKRRREEEEAEARLEEERKRARSRSREPKLKGQLLSEHQAEQVVPSSSTTSKYSSRVRELEKELELARQREAEYQARRQKPGSSLLPAKPRARSRSRTRVEQSLGRSDSWSKGEKEVLRTPLHSSSHEASDYQFPDTGHVLSPKSPRPLPDPNVLSPSVLKHEIKSPGRPLPNPDALAQPKDTRPLPQAPSQPPRRMNMPEPDKITHEEVVVEEEEGYDDDDDDDDSQEHAAENQHVKLEPAPPPAFLHESIPIQPRKPIVSPFARPPASQAAASPKHEAPSLFARVQPPQPPPPKHESAPSSPFTRPQGQRPIEPRAESTQTATLKHESASSPLARPPSRQLQATVEPAPQTSPNPSPATAAHPLPKKPPVPLPTSRKGFVSPFTRPQQRQESTEPSQSHPAQQALPSQPAQMSQPPQVMQSSPQPAAKQPTNRASWLFAPRNKKDVTEIQQQYGHNNSNSPTKKPSPPLVPLPSNKSLLEREKELEQQRQKEWEDAQKETATLPRPADGGVDGIGGGIGGRWDVNQWSGFTGGDNQSKGSQGIGAGRRPIVGPRPLPGQR